MTTWRSYISREADEICARWARPCREMFSVLVTTHPHDLLSLVVSKTLTPGQLTFAAEDLGNISFDGDDRFYSDVKKALLDLVMVHDSPMVREGALYGLSSMGAECRLLLANLAIYDKSEGIRSIAKEMLESGL